VASEPDLLSAVLVVTRFCLRLHEENVMTRFARDDEIQFLRDLARQLRESSEEPTEILELARMVETRANEQALRADNDEGGSGKDGEEK